MTVPNLKRPAHAVRVRVEPARLRYAKHDDRRAYEALVTCMQQLIAAGEKQ